MAVIAGSDLHKDVAGRPLLEGVSFRLERGQRMTVAGRNGAGKTTLLRMLAGESSIDGGDLQLEKGARVALHDQRPPRERAVTLGDYVFGGCREALALEAELERLEGEMAGGGDRAMERYAQAQARFELVGGYTWRDQALATVRGLGFAEPDLERSLESFSGGELTRASLARVLAAAPDVLLLDEPTNHLDIESLEWLEDRLRQVDAAVVLVAHDRWFLESVGTCVLELEAGRGRFFNGPWHAWRAEQAARELAQGRAIARQEKEIERMERFVERFRYKATKARQAQSRLKKLEKMERLTEAPRDRRGLEFTFEAPERSGRVVFELEDGRVEVPGRTLVHEASMWLERGEHVSLVGPNGSGKTTLLRALTGERPLDGGRLKTGHSVQVGYLSQHGEELEFGGARTVLEAAVHQTGLTPNEARALLGRFLFSGEEAEKPLDGLSGGERKRLGLAVLVAGGANVLVLDEPTNHLDLESREALEDALSSYEGAVLLVTHDRALLDAVGTRTVAVEDFTLRSYTGGWAEYARAREQREGSTPAPAPQPRGAGKVAGDGAGDPGHGARERVHGRRGGPSKNRLRRRAELEAAVEEAETAMGRLEEELSAPESWATAYETAKSQARMTAARRAVEAAWTELEEFEESEPATAG